MSSNSSVLSKSINGVKWMSFSSIVTTIVNFLLTIVLARLLTSGDYGTFQAIAVLIGFADMLWSLGVGPAIIRKKDLTRDDIATGHTINILLGVLIFLGVNIWAPIWCSLFSINSQNMLRVYSVIFIFNTVMAVPKSILYRECKYKILALSSVAGVVAYAVLGVLFAVMGLGSWALIVSTLFQYGIQLFWVVPLSKVSFEIKIKKASLSHLIYFGGGYTLMQFFNYIAMQGDNFLVNKLFGNAALGYYGKAYNLMGYPANLVGQTIDQVMYPILSQIQDDKEKLKRIFCSEMCFIGIVCVPITVVGVICGNELVLFLLGDEWRPVIAPMMVMVGGLFFRSAYKLNYTVLKSLGKVYLMSLMQLAYAVMVILGGYAGHSYGIVGVASGVVIAVIFNYMISLLSLVIELHISIREIVNNLKAPFLYSLLMYPITFYIRKTFVHLGVYNHFVMLAVITITVFTLYFGIYRLTHRFLVPKQANEYLDRSVKQVLNRITVLHRRKIKNESI